jgi:hypothetical protein
MLWVPTQSIRLLAWSLGMFAEDIFRNMPFIGSLDGVVGITTFLILEELPA